MENSWANSRGGRLKLVIYFFVHQYECNKNCLFSSSLLYAYVMPHVCEQYKFVMH